jgi:hypothetical protein
MSASPTLPGAINARKPAIPSGVTFRDLDESPSVETVVSDTVAEIDRAAIKQEILNDAREEFGRIVRDESHRQFAYIDKQAKDLKATVADISKRVHEELLKAAKPRNLIMAVDVQGIVRKLEMPAHPRLAHAIRVASAGHNIMFVGPAGSGKTFLSKQVAQALGRKYACVTLSEGATEAWLFGRNTPNGFQPAEFCLAYEQGWAFMIDESDNGNANVWVGLNNAVERTSEGFYNPIEGRYIKRHKDFVLMCGANTAGLGSDGVYTGRNRLDASTRDRFWNMAIGYEAEIEERLLTDKEWRDRLRKARGILTEKRAKQVISYRAFQCVSDALALGFSHAETIETLTLGWPSELVEQTGLAAPKGTGKKAS